MMSEHRFDDVRWLELSNALLDRLKGKMSLIQPQQERETLVAAALDSLYREDRDQRFPPMEPEARRAFLDAFLSYDLLEEFLADPAIEDIMINSTEAVFVHRTGVGLMRTERRFSNQYALSVFIKKLVVFGGRSDVDLINDVELSDIRGRVNIVATPFGPQITITRGKTQALTMLDLIERGMLPEALAAQLWIYVEGLRVRPANLVIAGGPGTGKTTLLNAMLSFIPSRERLVIIEDTLELNTGFLENCCRLESSRQVDLAALVKNSLRMRPDRILVGEVRGEEAKDLMTAINLGKYSMSTIHATSARETLLRLQNEPMNIPPVLISLIDVLIILRKENVGGTVSRIVDEVVETSGMEQKVVLLSSIWTFDHVRRQSTEASPSNVFRDKLASLTGRTPVQIMEETARRTAVLKAMRQSRRFTEIDAVTRCCQLYSDRPDEALHQLGLPQASAPQPHESRGSRLRLRR